MGINYVIYLNCQILFVTLLRESPKGLVHII